MKKVEDIKTPTNLEEFRQGLKKYCLGYKDSIFIYNKINNIKVNVDINKISKMSDIFKLIQHDNNLEDISSDCNLVLMCDISHINLEDLIVNKEDVIRELKEVYLFNNQDIYERTNFLTSTSSAIDKIVNGEKEVTNTYKRMSNFFPPTKYGLSISNFINIFSSKFFIFIKSASFL